MHNYAFHKISRMEEYFEHYIDNVSRCTLYQVIKYIGNVLSDLENTIIQQSLKTENNYSIFDLNKTYYGIATARVELPVLQSNRYRTYYNNVFIFWKLCMVCI